MYTSSVKNCSLLIGFSDSSCRKLCGDSALRYGTACGVRQVYVVLCDAIHAVLCQVLVFVAYSRQAYYTRRFRAWYIVHKRRSWVVVVVVVKRERERERERETLVMLIDIMLKLRVIMHDYLDHASTRRLLRTRVSLTTRVPSFFTHACKGNELGAWAMQSRDWWMTMEKLKLCVR